jgi:glucan phosphoethanolaminetransferase (alkaline phosphatase superfamily)
MGLVKVTNELSAAPTGVSATWSTFKQNTEIVVKKIVFIIFIVIIVIIIIQLLFWIYKYAVRKHLNNEIGRYQALLQGGPRGMQQQFAPYPPVPYPSPYQYPYAR